MSTPKAYDQELREIITMKPFPFFLDDVTRLKVLQKLQSIGLAGQQYSKGLLSATCRALLNCWANDALNMMQYPYSRQMIEAEYVFTTKKNKRSNM